MLIRKSFAALAVLAIALASIFAAEAAEEPMPPTGFATLGEAPPPRQAAVSDPSQVIANGWCYASYTWNGTRAQVYHPTNSTCSTAIYSPLVVFLRGNGFDYDEYHYLMRHLARNGFIAATIDVVSSQDDNAAAHQTAAQTAWDFVYDFLWVTWDKRFFINPNAVGVMGHSRGGETARYLADMLVNDPIFDVLAVVGLAPTGDLDLFMTGNETIGTMMLYGSSDPDVSPDQVYRHYDNAGNDDSQLDPDPLPDTIYKAMKLMQGGNHICFSEPSTPGTCFNADQRELTKGYVLAFLKGHLANDVTWYEDYVRGDLVPFGWSQDVVTQYSDGFYRRVIDHFDDGNLSPSTIGGQIISQGTVQSVVDLTGDGTSPHEAEVLEVQAMSSIGFLAWTIPSGKRDASLFKWLSLRIGQRSADPTSTLFVRIRNGNAWSPLLRVSDYGAIAETMQMCVQGTGTGFCSVIDDQDHMGTIRIPLADFGAFDDVRAVALIFAGDAVDKEFLIDNLAFSEFILKP